MEDFLVAYPDGFARTWNYGVSVDKRPKPLAGKQPVDDVLFLRMLIESLKRRAGVDPRRVYLAGTSYGGMMAFTAACALSGELGAVAVLITGMSEQQRVDCSSSKPMPLLIIAGTKDAVQTYGGEFLGLTPLLSVPETVAFWKKRNNCTTATEENLTHRDSSDLTTVELTRYSGCAEGAEIAFYKIEGGGHQFPSMSAPARDDRNRDIETAEVLWTFFRNFPR